MQNTAAYGIATLVTVSAAQCITSANAQIIGVLLQANATQACRIWAGVTATAAPNISNTLIRGYSTGGAVVSSTLNPAVYVPLNVYCSGGITLDAQVQNPNLTLFWNPTGGP